MSQATPAADKRTVVRVGLVNRPRPQSTLLSSTQSPANNNIILQYRSPEENQLGGSVELFQPSNSVSYRRQQEDVSSRQMPNGVLYRIEDDRNDGDMSQDSNDSSVMYQLITDEAGNERLQPVSLKDLTADDANTTVVQCTPGPDGQLLIPMPHLNSSRLVLPPGMVVRAGGPAGTSGSVVDGGHFDWDDESVRKRHLRLLKNKEAAKECRRKKKEYVRCLENRVTVLENQNRTLIEELKSLKELYCQKDICS